MYSKKGGNFLNIYENIKKLCKIKGMTISSLESAANLSNGAISKWKNKMPQADNLYNVAKILGTSIEFILTGNLEDSQENRESAKYSNDDLSLIEKYRKLDDCEKQIILGKISEMIYNKKMEESSEKLSSKVLWNLLADSDYKDQLVPKHKE
jgi:transcriptional regulator with XRE-family HTH domain